MTHLKQTKSNRISTDHDGTLNMINNTISIIQQFTSCLVEGVVWGPCETDQGELSKWYVTLY